MIARINTFHAAAGRGEELRERLLAIVGSITDSEGAINVTLLRSQDEPDEFVVYETWDSAGAHQSAAAVIPPDLIASTVAMLARPPSGRYLTIEGSGGPTHG